MYRDTSIAEYHAANRFVTSYEESGRVEYQQLNVIEGTVWSDATDRAVELRLWGKATQSTISFYGIAHYYDCKIDMPSQPLYHRYHCGDSECMYCSVIYEAMEIAPNRINWPSYNTYVLSDFISYERYVEKYNLTDATDDSVYDVSISDLLAVNDRQEEEEEEEEEEYDDESSYDDDYDSYDDADDDAYDRTYNTYGYTMGQIVKERHFGGVGNGWIAPNGTFYYVPDYNNHGCGHWDTAKDKLGFVRDPNSSYYDPVDMAEQAGYIHLSSYYSTTHRFHFIPNRPTDAQKAVAFAYCEANGIPLPDALVPDDEESFTEESEEFTIKVYTHWSRVEESTMPRAMRDRFYPLSGD